MKLKKLMAALLSVVMVAGMVVTGVFANGGGADYAPMDSVVQPTEDSGSSGSGGGAPVIIAPAPTASALIIVDYELGEKYIESTATEEDWINSTSASTNIVSVTLSDGRVIEADEGKVLTLVVDGQHYDILDYVEKKTVLAGDWDFAETSDAYDYSEFAKFMNMAGNTAQYTYRAALTVEDNAIVEDSSIPALYATATADGKGLTGGSIVSNGPFFNGVIVKGASDYTIKDTKFTFIGDGANDFQGEAAAVLAEDDSTVTLDGVYINTAGVIRTAAAVKENGVLKIQNSVLFTEESRDTKEEYDALVVPMMKRTPFALGLEGVVRATNVLGSGRGIYSDSIIVSTGWGALSTDSGKAGVEALNVKNVLSGIGEIEVAQAGKTYDATKTVNGVTYGFTMTGSGYVAYADAGVIDIFDSVEFYSGDYVQIMASSTSSAYYTNSELTSGRIAVMTQQNAGGTISIKDSTVNVADTVVQVKSGQANKGYTNIVLDNANINFTADNAWGGILVELVESDDAGNPGNTSFTVSDTGDTAKLADAKGTVTDTNATLKNGEYVGDIYNNIYYYYQALNVTLENADLAGTVSSSYGYHVDDEGKRLDNGTVLTAAQTGDYRVDPLSGDYIKIGAQVNVVEKTDANPVNLTIDAASTWTVGEVNYLNKLTVADTSALKGTGTVYASEFTVAGEAMADGTYTYGNVTVVVDYNEELATWLVQASDTGLLADTQDYAGNAFQIKVVDQAGANAARYLVADGNVKMNADGTVSFNIVPVEGANVKVVSVEGTDEITIHDCTQGLYQYGFTITPAPAEEGGAEGGMPGGDMGGMPGGDMGGGMPGGPGGMPGMGAASVATVTVTISLGGEDAPAGPAPDEKPDVPADPAPVVPSAGTYIVKPGDSLWKIAKNELGSGSLWSKIYETNKDAIKDPNMISIGQILQMP